MGVGNGSGKWEWEMGTGNCVHRTSSGMTCGSWCSQTKRVRNHLWHTTLCTNFLSLFPISCRVSYRGEVGGWNSLPSPQFSLRNLDTEYGYYCGAIMHVTGHTHHQNVVWKVCPRLCNLRGSKFKIFLEGMPQIPLVGTHNCACVSMHKARSYILASVDAGHPGASLSKQ